MYLRLFSRRSWFKYRQCLQENSFCKGLKSWKWILQTQSRVTGSKPEEEEHTRQSTSNFWILTNICNVSCVLCSSTRQQVIISFSLCVCIAAGKTGWKYKQTSYQHSQASHRLWTSHLLCPPSSTIQSHWSWFLTLHPGCSRAGSRARKENKQNVFWICKSSNNVCWLVCCI